MACIVCFLLFAVYTQAQDVLKGNISVNITGTQDQPLENATVELFKAKDSSLAKVAISDKNGTAVFEGIRTGTYFIKAGFINYTSASSSVFSLSAEQLSIKIPALHLVQAAAQGSEVVVTARKPFIQKLTDRLVVNVENSIVSAGSSAMEVLERGRGV